ncbi:MAG: HPr kinase/phosphorylase [Proteobacteria bacterium]|nr:HPr kinase/phosphorylase [Pseudomonadota bacterium]MDE3208571.1 HPr kinase/phosphorylase [Pseudomonadota bacterium]
MPRISIEKLFEDNKDSLALTLITGKGLGQREIENALEENIAPIIGHLNLVNPNQIQVLGPAEMAYLEGLPKPIMRRALKVLCASTTLKAIIVSNNEDIPGPLLRTARLTDTPVFHTPYISVQLIEALRHYLVQTLAEMANIHGVFMDIQGMGVLITGDSAIGKSELALELISRGHRLIADDVVDIYRVAPDRLEGRCPPLLQDFLEVRGLGILNIRALFGETSVRPQKNLRFIVHLEKFTENVMTDRLNISATDESILDVAVPRVSIPIAAGANMAVLVEVAVRNYILRLRGINSTQEFISRQQLEIIRNERIEDEEND